ncbi:MAG: GGDEF domain-containing protein, partial [Alphaproteobacteria bacterium]|nr:GGDEF domain-containing protein [Alphaproteobacteria bacterium]
MLETAAHALVIIANVALVLAVAQVMRHLGADRRPAPLDAQAAIGVTLAAAAAAAMIWSAKAGAAFPLPAPIGPVTVSLNAAFALVLLAGLAGGWLSALLALAGACAAAAFVASGGKLPIDPRGAATTDMIWLALLAVTGLVAGARRRAVPLLQRPGAVASLALLGAALHPVAAFVSALIQRAPTPDPLAIGAGAVLGLVTLLPIALIFAGVRRVDDATADRLQALEMAHLAHDAAADGALWFNHAGKVVYCNDVSCRLLGYSQEELLRRNLRDLDPSGSDVLGLSRRLQAPEGAWPRLFEARFISRAGTATALAVSATRVMHRGYPALALVLRAPGAALAQEQTPGVETASDGSTVASAPSAAPSGAIDGLTGLADAAAFTKRAGELAARAQRREVDNVTLALVDIDDLRGFNDRRGFAMGDALLTTYTRILRQALRGDDTAYRLEGDAFAVLMPGRGEGAFENLQLRFNDVMAAVRDAGFREASATVGFVALSEV